VCVKPPEEMSSVSVDSGGVELSYPHGHESGCQKVMVLLLLLCLEELKVRKEALMNVTPGAHSVLFCNH